MLKLRNVFYLLLLTLLCCKKPYNPPASSTPNSYLVVEGFINSGNDSTVIILSKTIRLTAKTTNNPVLGATVTVEGEKNGVYNLLDNAGNGHYNSYSGLNLSPSQRYRVKIVIGNRQYVSDFVEIKQTPPIDSVGFNIQNGNVNVYVNAHDATNNTRYYRWDYEETWQFHSKYQSGWMLDTTINVLVPRSTEESIYDCFGSDLSSHIVLTSTEKLASDVVYQNSVTQIPLSAEKVETRYSILLKQYAITQQAFEFYQNLQKNTEQLGSIFDAQPSQLSGNIHCLTDPSELVVGYITANNVQTKRIYISHNQIPDVPINYPYDCELDTARNAVVQGLLIDRPVNYIPTQLLFSKPPTSPPTAIGYLYSSKECIDCTLRGTKQAPPWWQ
ncbi:MAG: hypothetical protein JWQ66_2768 [Mucilaginibacter sp.]|nr:hypothetical protein [Mucilaginibacter sp.]